MQLYGFMMQNFENRYLSPKIIAPQNAPLHLTEIGLFNSRGGFRWEQIASRMALHCIRGGEGVFVEDGVAWPARQGDMVMFQPGRHYRYFDLPGRAWRYDFLLFDGPLPKGLLPDAALLPKSTTAWPTIEMAKDAFQLSELPFAKAAGLAWAVIEALGGELPGRTENLIDTVRNMVSRREDPFPTVSQIADHLGVDRSTLYRRFRAETGGSVKAWLDEQRMARAEHLLTHSNAPLREVAVVCGFRDPLYFSRAFVRCHDMPPGRWRTAQRD